VKLFVIEVGRRFYRTHLWGNAIILPLWGRVRIEPSRIETLQVSMSSGVLWGACKPLQCNSTCNNFITNLPLVEGYTFVMVITDKLFKGVIFQPMKAITAEIVAKELLKCFIRYHGIPRSIISNKGL
jgi:hypothetical protein